MSSEFRCIQVNSKEVSRCNKILRIRDVKCVAYSKPLLGAVPTKSGAAVRIKRQQLKAETQGQNANLGHKDILCFSSEFQRFQMKCSHHLACLSHAIVMEIQQINTSTNSFVVLQASFLFKSCGKNFLHNFHQE